MKYSYFYKKKLEDITDSFVSDNLKYDFFISAYNECERVNQVFNNVDSNIKHWLIFPEYGFEPIEISSLEGFVNDFSSSTEDEAEIILNYYGTIEEKLNDSKKVCVDITGFLRPYLVYLVRLLHRKGIKKIDFIYSEPKNYKKKENTLFSKNYLEIREIRGCSNSHITDTNNDILILGSGYDYKMISQIAKAKPEAKKIQILGFPPLQADMFQENIIKVYEADVASGDFQLDSDEVILAPANDPFVTAELISKYVKKINDKKKITNLYLSPLSTKAQTLGIVLFYIFECLDMPASIIFPFSKNYSRETSEGISRIWIYTVEF
jgi:hypothetical protein